jgi:hypothetical protein
MVPKQNWIPSGSVEKLEVTVNAPQQGDDIRCPLVPLPDFSHDRTMEQYQTTCLHEKDPEIVRHLCAYD